MAQIEQIAYAGVKQSFASDIEANSETKIADRYDRVLAEYVEYGASTTPQWTKSYIYLGARLLATSQPNGNGSEFVQFQHPDRLGTRLITNATDANYFEQATLPFGTALEAESSGATNRRFTSYDRSSTTGLDYAVNRHYSSAQGRFTQADPIGMSAASLENPQSLNLYAYCGNDPINHTDPSGLLFGWLKRLINRVVHAFINAVVVAVITFITSGFQLHVAIAAGIADFVKELGLPKLGFNIGPGGTPPFNPDAAAGVSRGVSGLNKYIINNFAQKPAPGSFLDCFYNSGLATTHAKGQYADAKGFNKEAADL